MDKTKEFLLKGGGTTEVPFRPALKTDMSQTRYPGFKPETVVLPKGSCRMEGAMPLPCDIILDRDVAVTMRDGTVIYTDVFRPAQDGKYPVIIAWSPYGKEVGGWVLDDVPHRAGVPFNAVSGMQKFEGPDPAYWCAYGYVVLNPDIRGAYMSNGDIYFWSHRQALDGCDFIEWAAGQEWSNGNVGMSGNSWLAMSQWMIAAERPEHLKAIAPWEGCSDIYRQITNRGGIPNPSFVQAVLELFCSDPGMVEDMPLMTLQQPLMSPYWSDKAFDLEKIDIPAYVVASYTSPIHTLGTFEGFRRIASKNKWLRIHLTQEWPDYYTPSHVEDLRKFFDRYLKEEENGWESTPAVRLSVYATNPQEDIWNAPKAQWPVEGTEYRKLYLDLDKNALTVEPQSAEQTLRYDSLSKESLFNFNYKFEEDTLVAGYIKLRLWVEAEGNDDMDLIAMARIVGPDGQSRTTPWGPPVARGLQRVSLRELNKEKSTDFLPVHEFKAEKKLSAGEVVPVDITLWPMGWNVKKGETLCLTLGAYKAMPLMDPGDGTARVTIPKDEFTFMPGTHPEMEVLGADPVPYPYPEDHVQMPPSINKGIHIIHSGSDHDSYLQIPVVKG